jgi:hypothetical protein
MGAMNGVAAMALEELCERGGDRRFIVDEEDARHYRRSGGNGVVRREFSLDIGIV